MPTRLIGLPLLGFVIVGLVLTENQPASSQSAPTTPPQASAAQADPLVKPPVPVTDGYRPVTIYQPFTIAPNHDPKAGDSEVTKALVQENQIEGEVRTLVNQYAGTEKEGDRAAIKKKLAANLEKQFDLQQKRREMEVARIEAQLKKLRDLIKKRTDARQSIKDRRMDQLIQEVEGLGWTSSSPLPPWRYDFVPPVATHPADTKAAN